MNGKEEHKKMWALGLSVTLSLFIFVSFAFYKGYIDFGVRDLNPGREVASVVSAKSAPSPVQNSKVIFGAAFGEIKNQFDLFKQSLSSVLVPFISSIEVYERQ